MKQGCLGCLGLAIVLFVIAGIFGSFTGHSSSGGSSSSSSDTTANHGSQGWSHKAVARESEAGRIVGGFSDEDRHLYHNGLQHIRNEHQKVGTLTIRQVIEGERGRVDARQAAVAAAKAAEDANFMRGDPDCLMMDQRSTHNSNDEYVSYVVGTITNRCDKTFGYVQVEINFYSDVSSGSALRGSTLANVNNLSSGQRWDFKAINSDNLAWRVEKITGF